MLKLFIFIDCLCYDQLPEVVLKHFAQSFLYCIIIDLLKIGLADGQTQMSNFPIKHRVNRLQLCEDGCYHPKMVKKRRLFCKLYAFCNVQFFFFVFCGCDNTQETNLDVSLSR